MIAISIFLMVTAGSVMPNTQAPSRGWAHATGELWKVIGFMQSGQSVTPLVPVYQVVPFRYQIMNGATFVGLAKGHAAIHASRTLSGEPIHIMVGVDFVEVEQTFFWRPIRSRVAWKFNEAGWFTHLLFFNLTLLIYTEWWRVSLR